MRRRQPRWEPSKVDVLFVAGLALILWQAIAWQIGGAPSDQPILYVAMGLIGAGLGWKINLK